MKPRGMLMIEHRLIERMIDIIEAETFKIEKGRIIDEFTIDSIIDFMNFYADATHHGKEEDILFSRLENNEMSPEDLKLMQQLIEEHKFARNITADIVKAQEKYFLGQDTTDTIITSFNTFVAFYPKHVQKEDEMFFPNSEKYFSDSEMDAMLREFEEFDRTMIHKKYKSLVEQFEKK
jgi:hemerythrin-like domain-containing protein